MTFTYDLNTPIASNLARVRLLIGDTVTPGDMSDEEIDFFLERNAQDVENAALAAARGLVAKFASEVDKQVGDLRISASQKHKGALRLVENLKAGFVLPDIYAGGQSEAEATSDSQDTDLPQPKFAIGMNDFPGTTDRGLLRDDA